MLREAELSIGVRYFQVLCYNEVAWTKIKQAAVLRRTERFGVRTTIGLQRQQRDGTIFKWILKR